jgi:hypothetical protein
MKTYATVAAILAVATLLSYTHRQAYRLGRMETQAKYDRLQIHHRERESQLLLSLQKAREERKVVYRDRIKTIRTAHAGCLDRPVPDSVAGLLRHPDDNSARSATDPGL